MENVLKKKKVFYNTHKTEFFEDFQLSPMNSKNSPDEFLFLNEDRYIEVFPITLERPLTTKSALFMIYSIINYQESGEMIYYNIIEKRNLAGFIYFFINLDNIWECYYAIKPEYEGLGWMKKSTFFLLKKLYMSGVKKTAAHVRPYNIRAVNKLQKERWIYSCTKKTYSLKEKKLAESHYYLKTLGKNLL